MCKHCDFLAETFKDSETNYDYWLMTEVFVYLHNGKDYCDFIPTQKDKGPYYNPEHEFKTDVVNVCVKDEVLKNITVKESDFIAKELFEIGYRKREPPSQESGEEKE